MMMTRTCLFWTTPLNLLMNCGFDHKPLYRRGALFSLEQVELHNQIRAGVTSFILNGTTPDNGNTLIFPILVIIWRSPQKMAWKKSNYVHHLCQKKPSVFSLLLMAAQVANWKRYGRKWKNGHHEFVVAISRHLMHG